MRAWLDQSCGPAGWGSAPAGTGGIVNDAVAFYFADRAAARADLHYWQAAVVVVAGRERHADALVTTVTSLIGPGVWDEDGEVWRWDVRTLTE